MKSGNYDESMDKFYKGTASAEEIDLLKKQGLLNDEDEVYAGWIQSERKPVMSWEFEDLMKEFPETKVVHLPEKSFWAKRMMAAAAVVAVILAAYIFWPQQQSKQVAGIPVIEKSIDSNPNLNEKVLIPEEKKRDERGLEKEIAPQEKNKSYAVKTSHVKQAKKPTTSAKNDDKKQNEIPDFYVIVNGKAITNEADAIAITRASLNMVSSNLASTIEELKPIGLIKIKL